MPKAAIAGFQKIVRKCPNCKEDGPKELVSAGEKKVRWLMFFLLIPVFPLLIVYPLWYKNTLSLQAYCPKCNKTFHPGKF